jgi:hypothetical protein
LLHDRAVTADACGLTLCGALDKKLVWVRGPAQGLRHPRPVARVLSLLSVADRDKISPTCAA